MKSGHSDITILIMNSLYYLTKTSCKSYIGKTNFIFYCFKIKVALQLGIDREVKQLL